MSTDNLGNENIDMAVGYSNGYKQGYEQGQKDAVKHGHWTYKHNGYARCSACGGYFAGVYDDDNEDKYCRRCGAKMDAKLGGDYLDGEKPAKG